MVSTKEAQAMLSQELAKLPPQPVGTLGFRLADLALSDPEVSGGVILQVAHGSHVFRLERETTPCVAFYHWSPGTGSRCAAVDVTGMEGSADFLIVISWSPQETRLLVAPVGQPQGSERWAKGVPSQRQFRVTRTGGIVQVGDHGVEVLQPTIFKNGILVLEPTAIESWQGVIVSAEILLSGQSTKGYMFDVVQCNSVLTALVTGFEWYCKKRFVELDGEGIPPDITAMISVGRSRQSPEADVVQEATQAQASAVRHFVEMRDEINFQDFDAAKKAYKKTYNVRFGNIGMSGNDIARLRRFIVYRHRIVHVSPILTPLNELQETTSKIPEFPNKELAGEAIKVFSTFVDLLHKATLNLRPPGQHAPGVEEGKDSGSAPREGSWLSQR